ncbi:MAG: HflK protein [Candidatus Omnitrophica bacterium 4484_70.1]|nr:MAG: HflK protein [Candidatus Omnitrophica bacterium 4484_70.1]
MDFRNIDPDEIIDPRRYISNLRSKNFFFYIILLVIISLITLFSSFYTVQPGEVGVLLRLGKFIKSTKPGLHLKIPWGIDRVYPVKVEFVYKEEFGFRTTSPGVRTSYSQRSYSEESLMLTGDLNVLDVEWIVQYKIKDPFAALFHIRDLRKTIRDISESVMRKIVGDYTFNEVLTTKRVEINDIAQQELQKILDSYNAGIEIITVKLQDVNPPLPVQPAFNEVNEAKQEKEKMINQAWEIYNHKIPEAKGRAFKIIKEAEGYALEKINNAQGEAKRFLLLLKAYEKAKDVTKRRLYLEKMNAVFKKAGKKYIVDPHQKSILPLLNLKNE